MPLDTNVIEERLKNIVSTSEEIKQEVKSVSQQVAELNNRLTVVEKYELEDRIQKLESQLHSLEDRTLILEQDSTYRQRNANYFWTNFLQLITIIMAGIILYVLKIK